MYNKLCIPVDHDRDETKMKSYIHNLVLSSKLTIVYFLFNAYIPISQHNFQKYINKEKKTNCSQETTVYFNKCH